MTDRTEQLRAWALAMVDMLLARLLIERDSAVGRREYGLAEAFHVEYRVVLRLYERMQRRARRVAHQTWRMEHDR